MTPWILAPTKPLALTAGALADLNWGDPPHLPHPVRLMGAAIEIGEPLARRLPLPPRLQGAILTGSLLLLTAGTVFGLLKVAFILNRYLGFLLEMVLIYYGLCARTLMGEVASVAQALKRDLSLARKRLSFLVSRQTADLSPEEVARGAIETLAENLIDGLISPLFYLALGGPVLLYTFKMASTLDSMIGYRNQRYREFGWAAARLDDLLNFFPARLGLVFILLATGVLFPRAVFKTFKGALKEARYHESPNAGVPEAAFAWALNVRLAGPTIYGKNLIKRPYFNQEGRLPSTKDIFRACRLAALSYGLALGTLILPGLLTFLNHLLSLY